MKILRINEDNQASRTLLTKEHVIFPSLPIILLHKMKRPLPMKLVKCLHHKTVQQYLKKYREYLINKYGLVYQPHIKELVWSSTHQNLKVVIFEDLLINVTWNATRSLEEYEMELLLIREYMILENERNNAFTKWVWGASILLKAGKLR